MALTEGDLEQAGIDAQERAEEMREQVLERIARHPIEHRAAFADRLLSMSTAELKRHLDLMDEMSLTKRDRPSYMRWDDPLDSAAVISTRDEAGEYDHDRELAGYDSRLYGDEPAA